MAAPAEGDIVRPAFSASGLRARAPALNPRPAGLGARRRVFGQVDAAPRRSSVALTGRACGGAVLGGGVYGHDVDAQSGAVFNRPAARAFFAE